MNAHRRLAIRLAAAVGAAFLGSLVLTWLLHDHLAERNAHRLIDIAFEDLENAIREAVDRRLVRQAMLFRDRLPALREETVWADPQAAAGRLREVAGELFVDELCVAGPDGILSHGSDPRDIGTDFKTLEGPAAGFRPLLDRETEVSLPIGPDPRTGERVKYVGVWLPEGGFVQVGCREATLRHLARSAVTGLTHNRHVSGNDGYMVITTASGTIISHLDPSSESGQWNGPPPDCHWQRREVEGFPVYAMVPKHAAVVERRVLVGTSAFLNAAALILASVLVGFVIAVWIRAQVRARRAKEMAMASDIQENAIPRVFPPFPEEKRMDLFASMKPARDVGGDFYDFFYSGSDRLVFLVADVSGKGVPAALFMMRAKTVLKNLAQTGRPLPDAVTEANEALCEGNAANMFVTAWIGELDLSTGTVTYVNAGHNPPLRFGGSAAPEYVHGRSGLMLGVMPYLAYTARELHLEPGQMLYLYTDGMTEQPDAKGELFGEERLRSAIGTALSDGRPVLDRGASPLLDDLHAAVLAHGGPVEQADDCTQLLIRWNGPSHKA